MAFSKTEVDALLKRIEEKRKRMPSAVVEAVEVRRPIKEKKKDHPPKEKPAGSSNITVTIHIDPRPAPRMTQRDRWYTDPDHKDPKKRQRLCVTRYAQYKKTVVAACAKAGWELGPVLSATFHIAMPDGWSRKKKEAMRGQLHRQRPDVDNLCKGIMDSFGADDGHVASLVVIKRWADEGSIVLS